MEPESSLRIIDVVAALLERGRVDEAIDYQFEVVYLALIHGLDVEHVLELSVDEYVKLYTVKRLTVPEKRGWDKVYYGEAAFKEERVL